MSPLGWIRASETTPRVAEARGLARPETRPASAPTDFARDASTGGHRTSSRPSRGDRRTGASTLNGAKTQHAREPVGTKRPARIFPSLRGNANADRKRLRPLIRVHSSGGKLPDTVTNPEWAKATAERMKSWEREGAPDRPIKLNPIKGGK